MQPDPVTRPDATAPPSLSGGDLELPLAELEARVAALGLALQAGDAALLEAASADLHGALARAVELFQRAARERAVPAALRRRLAEAGARVAAQRTALARAGASLDRALEVLMPRPAPRRLYSNGGSVERATPARAALQA